MSIEKQIADFKAEFNTRIAELEKQLIKKGPIVPWVGARVQRIDGLRDSFIWDEVSNKPETVEIIDSHLNPQFMPNDGVNPWPDDMVVQVILANNDVLPCISGDMRWNCLNNSGDIIGSRPACGWAEYLKERE